VSIICILYCGCAFLVSGPSRSPLSVPRNTNARSGIPFRPETSRTLPITHTPRFPSGWKIRRTFGLTGERVDDRCDGRVDYCLFYPDSSPISLVPSLLPWYMTAHHMLSGVGLWEFLNRCFLTFPPFRLAVGPYPPVPFDQVGISMAMYALDFCPMIFRALPPPAVLMSTIPAHHAYGTVPIRRIAPRILDDPFPFGRSPHGDSRSLFPRLERC